LQLLTKRIERKKVIIVTKYNSYTYLDTSLENFADDIVFSCPLQANSNSKLREGTESDNIITS